MTDTNSLDDLTGGDHRGTGGASGPGGRWLSLVLFIAFTLGGGTLIGAVTAPGPWYEALEKPFFNPPNWVFGPVWAVLYVMVAIAGWRTWLRGYRGLPMQLWFLQLAANFMWSPAFFGMQLPGLALLVIVVMGALTFLFIQLTWKPDRTSALVMLPYMAWVTFAGLINLAIWWMN